jgi:hypothetical protein
MKRDTIEWHEECLKNMQTSYAEDFNRVQFFLSSLSQQQKEIAFYEYQIAEAKTDKKEKFDRAKFRKKIIKKEG